MVAKPSSIIAATSPYHTAGNTTLFYLPGCDAFPSLRALLGVSSINEHLLSAAMRTCLQVVFTYGLRSAEALAINEDNWAGAERWFIPGAKGSRGALIYLPGSLRWYTAQATLPGQVSLFPFTYMELYRACVKCGIRVALHDHENFARTHASRYLIARQVAVASGTSGAQDALRHKRATSTAYYM